MVTLTRPRAAADAVLRDVYRDRGAPLRYKTYALDPAGDGTPGSRTLGRLMRRDVGLAPLSRAAAFVKLRDGRLVLVRGRARRRTPRRAACRSSAASGDSGDDGSDPPGHERCPVCKRPLLWVDGRLYCPTAGCGGAS